MGYIHLTASAQHTHKVVEKFEVGYSKEHVLSAEQTRSCTQSLHESTLFVEQKMSSLYKTVWRTTSTDIARVIIVQIIIAVTMAPH